MHCDKSNEQPFDLIVPYLPYLTRRSYVGGTSTYRE
jgi:hypothetical protein